MTYNLEITQAEVQLVGAALGKLPFEAVFALLSKIQIQVNAQDEAKAVPIEDVVNG